LFLSSTVSTIAPPLTSLLFPYTTLFRSHTAVVSLVLRDHTKACALSASLPGGLHLHSSHQLQPCQNLDQPALDQWPRSLLSPTRDRKSTRLNSSHLGISYAVFCLKKKKN